MAQDLGYGGFWARLVALILDSTVVELILLALGIGLATAGVGLPEEAAYAICVAVPLLYWAAMESSGSQATLGKRIMGLQVADADGNRLSFLRALLRQIAKIISAIPLGIGFLVAAFHPRKQALHDLVVKTTVPRVGPSHLWKLVVALILGLALMIAAAAGLFYFVVVPMFKQGVDSVMKGAVKSMPAGTVQTTQAPRSSGPATAPIKPSAPAAPAAPRTEKQGPDPEFDAVAGQPLASVEKTGPTVFERPTMSTRAGPAILERSSMFPTTVWIKVHVPVPPGPDAGAVPPPLVEVHRVLDAAGKDYYDADNTFEKSEFFRRPQLSQQKDPVPHLAGNRNVHTKPGLSEQNLQKIDGELRYRAPVDPKPAAFGAAETGKPKNVHDSVVTLGSVTGNAARLRFRGASENMLLVKGYAADGAALKTESRQILPANQDVDQDFTITFAAPPAKVEVVVAARIIERVFPFSLVRGTLAGPPSSASAGTTLAPRARAAPPAAPTPAPAPAPAPAPVAVKPAATPAPAPMPIKAAPAPAPVAAAVKPAPAPAPAAKAVAPAPKPAPAPTPVRRSRAHEDARECLDLPTNAEVIRCAEKFR